MRRDRGEGGGCEGESARLKLHGAVKELSGWRHHAENIYKAIDSIHFTSLHICTP